MLLPKIFFEAEFVHFGGEKFRRSKILRSPSLFICLVYSNEFYNEFKNFNELNCVGVIISITLPGLYIALQLYHYKALPLKFLVTIITIIYLF